MITDKILIGEKCYLRQIELSDCTERYVEWLNDSDINKYLETKWYPQNETTIKEFVFSQRKNNHSYLFAIIFKESDNHIGNIKIGPIDWRYKHADISYFIGEKALWGQGIASEAIKLICRFGFQSLGLHRIEAGAYEPAIGSQRALQGNGFVLEARFREQVYFESEYIDILRYALLESEFKF